MIYSVSPARIAGVYLDTSTPVDRVKVPTIIMCIFSSQEKSCFIYRKLKVENFSLFQVKSKNC